MQMDMTRRIDPVDAPGLAPDDRPIDLVHLTRMTMGDRSLEREVLQLFDRQSALLIARMRSAAPAGVPTLAHTLNGSARGIGAWRVARAAAALERVGPSDALGLGTALEQLAEATEEARTVISDLLRAS
jgi:HPt (histidine-containing phosphotransfer) domain-containing protein